MTIEIGNGQKDTIRVLENDDPNELAREFCNRHALNSSITFPLAQNIYSNMEQVINERAKMIAQYHEQTPTPKQERGYNSGNQESASKYNSPAVNTEPSHPVSRDAATYESQR